MRRVVVVWALAGVVLAGCASEQQARAPDPIERLSFLADGRTTREEVLLRFGAPARAFEGERILTYRLRNEKDGLVPASLSPYAHDPRDTDWARSDVGLVLVFGPTGVLERHSVRVSEK